MKWEPGNCFSTDLPAFTFSHLKIYLPPSPEELSFQPIYWFPFPVLCHPVSLSMTCHIPFKTVSSWSSGRLIHSFGPSRTWAQCLKQKCTAFSVCQLKMDSGLWFPGSLQRRWNGFLETSSRHLVKDGYGKMNLGEQKDKWQESARPSLLNRIMT